MDLGPVVAEQAVQLIGPPDEAGQLTALAQISPGVRVHEDLGEVRFRGGERKARRWQKVDPCRLSRSGGWCDGVERVVHTDVVCGHVDLLVERNCLRPFGDDVEIAVQQVVERPAVQDHQA